MAPASLQPTTRLLCPPTDGPWAELSLLQAAIKLNMPCSSAGQLRRTTRLQRCVYDGIERLKPPAGADWGQRVGFCADRLCAFWLCFYRDNDEELPLIAVSLQKRTVAQRRWFNPSALAIGALMHHSNYRATALETRWCIPLRRNRVVHIACVQKTLHF